MFRPTWARRVWAAVVAGVLAFFVCSLLPMWEVVLLSKTPGVVEVTYGNLWQMLSKVDDAEANSWMLRIDWGKGVVVTTVAVHLAMLAGAVLGGLWRRKELRE